jgi:putative restriction endonuclease
MNKRPDPDCLRCGQIYGLETSCEPLRIGINPDYRLHVLGRLLGQNDGPMLDDLKGLNGVSIHLPGRIKDRPDRDRLALRFERYKSVA